MPIIIKNDTTTKPILVDSGVFKTGVVPNQNRYTECSPNIDKIGKSGNNPTIDETIKKEVKEKVTSLNVVSRSFAIPKLVVNSLIIIAER